MQLIERSFIGVRAAQWRLASTELSPEVTLFPMIHVGEQAFYDQVYHAALQVDVVLVEGVNAVEVRRLTRSYRWINLTKLGLVLQPPFPSSSDAEFPQNGQVLHADLTGPEFRNLWTGLPWWQRKLATLLAFAVGCHRYLFLTRQGLARALPDVNDLSSRTKIFGASAGDALSFRAIHQARDDRLSGVLLALLQENKDKNMRVAVVYGANHMPKVLHVLRAFGEYQPVDSKWLNVITL